MPDFWPRHCGLPLGCFCYSKFQWRKCCCCYTVIFHQVKEPVRSANPWLPREFRPHGSSEVHYLWWFYSCSAGWVGLGWIGFLLLIYTSFLLKHAHLTYAIKLDFMSLFLCTCKTKKLENLWDILNAIVVYVHHLYMLTIMICFSILEDIHFS